MKKEHVIIAVIFFIVLGTRLFFTFQTPYFSEDQAYYNIRQVVHIKETLFPMFVDELSYGGKTAYSPPLFYYILATLSFVFKTEFVGKFFPNLFASSLVIIGYLIAGELTKNKTAKIYTAMIAGFVPIFFSETINNISINSFAIPLMFFAIYCMMKVIDKEKIFITFFIISLFTLRMTTPSVVFFIFTLLLYLTFVFLGEIKKSKIEVELILFSVFAITWTLFVGFKNSFLNYGLTILWQSIPKKLLENYFAGINLLTAIYLIGILPFVFGLYAIYKYAFRERDKKIYLLISFAIIIAILMWLRLIELTLALIFIGFSTTFLFTKSYSFIISKLKNKSLKLLFSIFIFLLIITSSVIPSIALASNKIKDSFSKDEIEALLWIRKNTNKEDIILSTLNEGHLISTIALRKNFIDSNFILASNTDERLDATYILYRTTSQTQAVELLSRNQINYIYFSKRAKKEYNIEIIPYIDDKCFKQVFNNTDVQIYESLCIIKEK